MEKTLEGFQKTATAKQSGMAINTRIIIACSLGNALEWFDFVAYAMFATVIAKLYFPTGNDLTSLLATFATFAVGFVMRPIGAVLLGSYGDRAGRKAALTATIMLMAVGTGMIAVTPTFDQIGIIAPILIVTARMIQGLSAGGEIGGAISFLLEHAPKEKRAVFSGWLQASVGFFYLLAGSVGFAIAKLFNVEQIESWGWRIPFILGLCIIPVGIYIRSRLDESPLWSKGKREQKAPLAAIFRNHFRPLAIGAGIVIIWAVCSQTINYMPTYTQHELGMDNSTAFFGLFVVGVISLFSPLVGRLADKVGRRPIMIVAAAGMMIVPYPAFHLLTSHPVFEIFIAVQLLLVILLTFYSAPASAALAELFTTDVRSTGIALSYNSSVTLFGGFTPSIAMLLINKTGDGAALAYYLMGAAMLSLIALLYLRDRTGENLS